MVGQVLTGPGEDLRDLAELLADDADPKGDLAVFEPLDRLEELLGILVMLPAGCPEDSQRARVLGGRAGRTR